MDSNSTSNNIELVTHDPMLFAEFGILKCNDSSPVCIYDGSALERYECDVCKRKFPEERHLMKGGSPICNQIMSYLKENESYIRNYYKIPDNTQVVPDEDLLNLARKKYRKNRLQWGF